MKKAMILKMTDFYTESEETWNLFKKRMLEVLDTNENYKTGEIPEEVKILKLALNEVTRKADRKWIVKGFLTKTMEGE